MTVELARVPVAGPGEREGEPRAPRSASALLMSAAAAPALTPIGRDARGAAPRRDRAKAWVATGLENLAPPRHVSG